MNSTARLLASAAVCSLTLSVFAADLQDAQPVDLGQLLQALRGIKDQQTQQTKAAKHPEKREHQISYFIN